MKSSQVPCAGIVLFFALINRATGFGGVGVTVPLAGAAVPTNIALGAANVASQWAMQGTTTLPGAVVGTSEPIRGPRTQGPPKGPCCQVDAQAEDAWTRYIMKCEGDRYDPKKTTPAECGNLSGTLCSRQGVVKCSADKTDFLGRDGKVIATADHKTLQICDPSGQCRQPRKIPQGSDRGPKVQAPPRAPANAAKGSCCQVDAEAEAAWRKYTAICVGDRYDDKKTSPSECGTLSGNLCSQSAVVKCGAGKTQFLKDGKVIATGDDKTMKICDSTGACRS